MVYGQSVPILNLDDYIERRRLFALKHGLLRPAPTGLLVPQGHRLDTSHQVGQCRVHHQVVQGVAVGGAHQLDAALRDSSRCFGFQLPANLVDDDYIGHVVLDRFDHHLVLQRRHRDLHATRATDGRMWDVTITANLVGCIDDDHPFLLAQNASHLSQHGRFADTGPAQ